MGTDEAAQNTSIGLAFIIRRGLLVQHYGNISVKYKEIYLPDSALSTVMMKTNPIDSIINRSFRDLMKNFIMSYMKGLVSLRRTVMLVLSVKKKKI
jgi:hypothetical protein